MKTLASFSKPYEAHLLIARLEGSGIAAYARDENLVTMDWLYSSAVGGVKVDVSDEDYEKALEFLEPIEVPLPSSLPKARKPLRRYLLIAVLAFLFVGGYFFSVLPHGEVSSVIRACVVGLISGVAIAAVSAMFGL